jgi:hypothetical protein
VTMLARRTRRILAERDGRLENGRTPQVGNQYQGTRVPGHQNSSVYLCASCASPVMFDSLGRAGFVLPTRPIGTIGRIEACLKFFPPIPVLMRFGPHFSLMEFSSVENERMIPQQAVSAVSTIDDIETYLTNMKGSQEAEVLSAVDMAASERRTVMRELAMMGITAGSLFPGL